jgi:large repetitive protein
MAENKYNHPYSDALKTSSVNIDGSLYVSGQDISKNPVFIGNQSLGLPTGTTSQRPTNPQTGYVRFNTDTKSIEVFNGTSWSSAALSGNVPGLPTNVSGTSNVVKGSVISFTPPTYAGDSAITSYTVTATPVSASSSPRLTTGSSSPITLSNLENATTYAVTVVANNSFGSSNPSIASSAFSTAAYAPPPTNLFATVTAYNTASISFTPASSGNPISYTVTASPGGATGTGTTSPITVSGLNQYTSYTFTATTTNSIGVGIPSGVSNAIVTPGNVVTGGTLTSDSTYYYRTFTANGTLAVSGGPGLTADVLAIAGGGGGGYTTDRTSGGGGAGGVLYSPNQTISSSAAITVGAGGAVPSNGANSTFAGLTAIGGGNGGGSASFAISTVTYVGTTITVTTTTPNNLAVGSLVTTVGIATTGTNAPNSLSNAVITPASGVSSITSSGAVVTITTVAAHGLSVGQSIQIANTTISGSAAPNGNWTVYQVLSATQFTVIVATPPVGTISLPASTTTVLQTPSYNYAGLNPWTVTAINSSTQFTFTATLTPTGTLSGGNVGVDGGNGGSGGGGNHNGAGNRGGTGTSGQGYNGGIGYDSSIGVFGGSGGGGAGSAGGNGGPLGGGFGGAGTSAYSSWGLATGYGQNSGGTYYFGGGGGGAGQTLIEYASGLQSATMTYSGTTITVTTPAAHGLTAGQYVYVMQTGAATLVQTMTNSPNGLYTVASVTSTTVFTFTVPVAPVNGATPGTITGAPVIATPTASFTYSGTTITCTTPAAHGLIVGQYISVYVTTAGSNAPNGNWIVTSAPTATTFQFVVPSAPTGTITNGIVNCPGEGVTAGAGGLGGGGNGGVTYPVSGFAAVAAGGNGLANTGGGGGGSAIQYLSNSASGTGGSGLVIVRYARSQVGG